MIETLSNIRKSYAPCIGNGWIFMQNYFLNEKQFKRSFARNIRDIDSGEFLLALIVSSLFNSKNGKIVEIPNHGVIVEGSGFGYNFGTEAVGISLNSEIIILPDHLYKSIYRRPIA